jgi:hypothetical protein
VRGALAAAILGAVAGGVFGARYMRDARGLASHAARAYQTTRPVAAARGVAPEAAGGAQQQPAAAAPPAAMAAAPRPRLVDDEEDADAVALASAAAAAPPARVHPAARPTSAGPSAGAKHRCERAPPPPLR